MIRMKIQSRVYYLTQSMGLAPLFAKDNSQRLEFVCFKTNFLQKLTGCQSMTHFVQIALTPKQAGLVWTFFKQNNSFGQPER